MIKEFMWMNDYYYFNVKEPLHLRGLYKNVTIDLSEELTVLNSKQRTSYAKIDAWAEVKLGELYRYRKNRGYLYFETDEFGDNYEVIITTFYLKRAKNVFPICKTTDKDYIELEVLDRAIKIHKKLVVGEEVSNSVDPLDVIEDYKDDLIKTINGLKSTDGIDKYDSNLIRSVFVYRSTKDSNCILKYIGDNFELQYFINKLILIIKSDKSEIQLWRSIFAFIANEDKNITEEVVNAYYNLNYLLGNIGNQLLNDFKARYDNINIKLIPFNYDYSNNKEIVTYMEFEDGYLLKSGYLYKNEFFGEEYYTEEIDNQAVTSYVNDKYYFYLKKDKNCYPLFVET